MEDKDIFRVYNIIKPLIAKREKEFKVIINKEFKTIQQIKTTSMNENYLFNDVISAQFYRLLDMDKLTFKKIIDANVKCTNNYDSKDANNVLLLLLGRYALETKQDLLYHVMIQMLAYKIYFPVFTKYFKFGVDESAFKYFANTLPKKFDIARFENIYGVVDDKAKAVAGKYIDDVRGKNAAKLLLIPVHIKTRLNQFFKQLLGAYKRFIQTNKIHLNSSRDLENEEGDTFNDQGRNNNSLDLEYKNRLHLALIHMELPDNMKYSILHRFHRSSKNDVDLIYKLIKHDDEIDNICKIFIEMRDQSVRVDDKSIILKWDVELGKYSESEVNDRIDALLFKYIPEYAKLEKKALIEKRKIFITLIYCFFIKAIK